MSDNLEELKPVKQPSYEGNTTLMNQDHQENLNYMDSSLNTISSQTLQTQEENVSDHYSQLDRNGINNSIGSDLSDIFSMFSTLDTDDTISQDEIINKSGWESPEQCLSRPGSISPATLSWLQTITSSTSLESLAGFLSPAPLFYNRSPPPHANIVASSIETKAPVSNDNIDWKMCHPNATGQWRVIPQIGPHAQEEKRSDVNSNGLKVGVSSMGEDGIIASYAIGVREQISQQLDYLRSKMSVLMPNTPSSDGNTQVQSVSNDNGTIKPVIKRSDENKKSIPMDDGGRKRRMMTSPEYIQFNVEHRHVSVLPESSTWAKRNTVKYSSGGRPLKQSLPLPQNSLDLRHLQHKILEDDEQSNISNEPTSQESVRCKCTGKCRNTRCVCVKSGLLCSAYCRCVGCTNPFAALANAGIDIKRLVLNVCMMQNLSKIKDMTKLLNSEVDLDCTCTRSKPVKIKVMSVVEDGVACQNCEVKFQYSWCTQRLYSTKKNPRRHCALCRRCGDHRNRHCRKCNHCYFAGVGDSFTCQCLENSQNKGPDSAPSNIVHTKVLAGRSTAANSLDNMLTDGSQNKNVESSTEESLITDKTFEASTANNSSRQESCPIQ